MSKFASSIENLVRRSSKQDSKVLSINILVEFYNALSLKHVVPFRGFDLQSELCEDMELRFSKEGDEFTSLDSEQKVAFPLGEAVVHVCIQEHRRYSPNQLEAIKGGPYLGSHERRDICSRNSRLETPAASDRRFQSVI